MKLRLDFFKSRVGCYSASCEKCSECTSVLIDRKGRKNYSCPHRGEKHQIIGALECQSFRCNNANKDLLCKYCESVQR